MNKSAVSDYKKRELTGGVYGIRNKITGKVHLQSAVNLEGKKERFDFAVSSKTASMFLSMQEEWKKYGAESFEYVVYGTIAKKDESDYDFAKLVNELFEEWKEKLKDILA